MRSDPAKRDFMDFQKSRSPKSMARVFDKVAPDLLLVAYRLTRDTSAAEDLVQATFLAAMDGANRFDPERELGPWLVGILMRLASQERRANGRRLVPEGKSLTGPEEQAM